MTPRIRRATLADAAGIARVIRAEWESTYSDFLSADWFAQHPLENWIGSWENSLRVADERHSAGKPNLVTRVVAVGEDDDGERVVGVAVAGPSRPRGQYESAREQSLDILYVLTEYHGTGAARALVDAALPGNCPAELWVADPNPRAQAFYRKCGFAPDGSRQINRSLSDIPEIRMVR